MWPLDFHKPPIAIVSARKYIFSENKVGILGNLAAGKEQTFGTLTARLMAWIGGKLHYKHPNFLNAVYMVTRGRVSKAQKDLHLNDDIYAGMNVFGHGGKIKHTNVVKGAILALVPSSTSRWDAQLRILLPGHPASY